MIQEALTRAHKRVGAVQGGLSLVIEKRAFSQRFVRVYIGTLRSVADDLEQEIKP